MDKYIQGNPEQLITIQLHITNSVVSPQLERPRFARTAWTVSVLFF